MRVRLGRGAAPSNEQLFHQTRPFMGWLPASLRAALNCSFLAKTQKLKHLLARGHGSACLLSALLIDGWPRTRWTGVAEAVSSRLRGNVLLNTRTFLQ